MTRRPRVYVAGPISKGDVAMMASVIFLDFDGVVLCERAYRRGRVNGQLVPEPSCVAALNRITRESGAQIVVSSTWRMFGEAKVRALLAEWGVEAEVIGITPDLSHRPPRGVEIQTWLARNPSPRSFVILDDDKDMGHLLPYLVRTSFSSGLTEADADRAIAILNRVPPSQRGTR